MVPVKDIAFDYLDALLEVPYVLHVRLDIVDYYLVIRVQEALTQEAADLSGSSCDQYCQSGLTRSFHPGTVYNFSLSLEMIPWISERERRSRIYRSPAPRGSYARYRRPNPPS